MKIEYQPPRYGIITAAIDEVVTLKRALAVAYLKAKAGAKSARARGNHTAVAEYVAEMTELEELRAVLQVFVDTRIVAAGHAAQTSAKVTP